MIGEINIKIIVEDGIVQDVLSDDTRVPICVEIVDVDKDYADYEELRQYRDELYKNRSYDSIFYTYSDFKKE